MKQSIVHIALVVRENTDAEYGTVAVFEDLYGNRWDLIGPSQPSKT